MKKTLMALTLALSLSLLGCKDVSIEKKPNVITSRARTLVAKVLASVGSPVIKAPILITSDEDTINEMAKNAPEGYTLLGDAVSGWHYVYTSCGNGMSY